MPLFTERVHSTAFYAGRIYVVDRQFQNDARRCLFAYGDVNGSTAEMPCMIWNQRRDGAFDVDSFDTLAAGYCGVQAYCRVFHTDVDVVRLAQITMAGVMAQQYKEIHK